MSKATTAEQPAKMKEKRVVTPIERVRFTDGMIVTADDLDTAMHYPTALLKTVLRSYFGCGVVCGLRLEKDPRAGDGDTYVLCVGAGVAFDCHGYPVELCGGIKLDLTPDPCVVDETPELYIAIRRATVDEAPHDPCTCDTHDPRFQCSRIRDVVVVKAFAEIDATFCATEESTTASAECGCGGGTGDGGSSQPTIEGLCHCLKACETCDCSAESWIVLGKVTRGDNGISVDHSRRRYVKPIECMCAGVPELPQVMGRLEDLEEENDTLQDRITDLESKVAEYHKDDKLV